MPNSPDSSLWRSRALVFLAVLAPALGGSTELWARGVLLLATAAVLLLWPPRRMAPGSWLFLGGALLALSALAFVPANWFPAPPWRGVFTKTFEAPLPATMSPQPWLSAEGAGQLFAAIVFTAALVAHGWRGSQRREAAQGYALGILFLTAVAAAAFLAKWHVPWWPHTSNLGGADFGFFPNRNQTADVLALAGILMTALAWESLNRRRRSGYAWFGGLAVIGAALVIAFSRAGIALFLGGAVLWVFLSLRFSASKQGATLAFAAVLLLLSGFFLFGGETLKRFARHDSSLLLDYRLQVQGDAWRLAAQRPWLGQGLANFEGIFAVTREPSFRQDRALHPESDWLWAAVEQGWPAVALIVIAVVLWAWRTWPFESGTNRYLRSAAAVCGLAFLVHGLVDVSGHRAGSLWPALFLFSLAIHPARPGAESRWAAPFFRGCALLVAGFGGWWLYSACWPAKTQAFPTSATVAWLEDRAEKLSDSGRHTEAVTATDSALAIAPLRWRLYYLRGVARAGLGDFQAAASDFDTARFLEPRWIPLCLGEGRVWLSLDEPELTLDAWTEALRRAGPDAPGLYEQLLNTGWSRLTLRNGLAQLAERSPALLVAYLDRVGGLDFDAAFGHLLARDPDLHTLTPAQRRRLFAALNRNGGWEQLVSMMNAHPEWMEEAWEWIARRAAKQGDFERAWRFVERYETPPALPAFGIGQSVAALERNFHFHPDDIHQGLALYATLRQLRLTDEALTTLHTVAGIPGRPDYVLWLEAELWAEKHDWQKAGAAWEKWRAAVKR